MLMSKFTLALQQRTWTKEIKGRVGVSRQNKCLISLYDWK